jgi:hypothetical protein
MAWFGHNEDALDGTGLVVSAAALTFAVAVFYFGTAFLLRTLLDAIQFLL